MRTTELLVPNELIVPLDGSANSTRALPVADRLARALHATVGVVDCLPLSYPAEEEARWIDRQVEAADVVVTLREVHPTLDVVDDLVTTVIGRPGSSLCAATHGHTGPSEIVFGSVTRELLLRSPVPMVVIGPACRLPERFERIQLCFDGAEGASTVIDVGAAWAAALGATPWITHVVEGDVPDDATAPGDVALDGVVFRAADKLRARGLEPEWDVLHGRNPAESLTAWARVHGSDLLVIRSHQRSLVARALGTTTSRIFHQAPCPVVVVGPAVGG